MFTFDALHDTDLRRYRAVGPYTPAEIWIHVEASFTLVDAGDVVYSETDFPVVALATDLHRWTRRPQRDRDTYLFDDRYHNGFTEDGAVRIVAADAGWRVGSVFAPDTWTRAISTEQLDHAVAEFVSQVIHACRTQLGLDVADMIHVGNRGNSK
ncbi:DUF7878 domain-containing protein [Amycolatopsis samaneae]|uniref:DUF7878 domain-containing protein n=1 Tax=Amycolatopsis samaneae TaxID=664691 RepID=A0ABW5GUK4_9PSEU